MTPDNNRWPDPARPGVPPSEGWWWLLLPLDVQAIRYFDGEIWRIGGQLADPKDFAKYTLVGPVLTPAEVEARVKEAKRDALEEAARWHDEQERFWMEKGREVSALDSQSGLNLLAKAAEHRKHAAAIRALKGEGND